MAHQTIKIAHLGDGAVSFQVPINSGDVKLKLSPQSAKTFPNQNESIQVPIYFDLLEVGGTVLGKNGAFYVELLREGFLKNGAISLIGFSPETDENQSPKQIFRTVLHFDGDLTCKVSRALLKQKNMDELMRTYARIHQQMMSEFQSVMGSLLMGLIAFFSSIISFMALFYRFTF